MGDVFDTIQVRDYGGEWQPAESNHRILEALKNSNRSFNGRDKAYTDEENKKEYQLVSDYILSRPLPEEGIVDATTELKELVQKLVDDNKSRIIEMMEARRSQQENEAAKKKALDDRIDAWAKQTYAQMVKTIPTKFPELGKSVKWETQYRRKKLNKSDTKKNWYKVSTENGVQSVDVFEEAAHLIKNAKYRKKFLKRARNLLLRPLHSDASVQCGINYDLLTKLSTALQGKYDRELKLAVSMS